ncbi:MAG: response regulator [Opitutia bacterium Tous-C1TDCM]|nr:MAG: response regulator [Opitutae bacterium Tous-C1TDCM]
MKILAVEDDPVAQLVIESALKSLGHEVLLAVDGGKAWELLADRSIRAVVSDWRLPELDGLDLCRLIRGRGGDYVSFILLTQLSASEVNIDAAIAAGVDDFLTKPVNIRDLKLRLHAAERVLGLNSQVRQLEGFLPICAHCKKIRDDRNYWQQIESYLNARTGTRFSHGICPDCYEKITVPELERFLSRMPPPEPPRTDAAP